MDEAVYYADIKIKKRFNYRRVEIRSAEVMVHRKFKNRNKKLYREPLHIGLNKLKQSKNIAWTIGKDIIKSIVKDYISNIEKYNNGMPLCLQEKSNALNGISIDIHNYYCFKSINNFLISIIHSNLRKKIKKMKKEFGSFFEGEFTVELIHHPHMDTTVLSKAFFEIKGSNRISGLTQRLGYTRSSSSPLRMISYPEVILDERSGDEFVADFSFEDSPTGRLFEDSPTGRLLVESTRIIEAIRRMEE